MSDHKDIVKFTTCLRKIEGLRLFRIFTKYTSLIDIQNVFNCLGKCENESDLRELERLWEEFMEEKNEKKNDKQD
jgi:hypothetical protein